MSRSDPLTSQSSPAGPERGRPSPARIWWRAARPATWAASVAPVLVGSSVAVLDGRARAWPGLGALLVAVALQVGVNYANDYSDFRRGADTPDRIGPWRAAASGLVPPGRVRTAALLAFGVAAAAGLLLCLATDPRLLAVGALCLAAGWLYTGGPRPYGYLGLGEAFVFVFFGLVATAGTVYVQELRLPPLALLAGLPTGCLAVAILLLNNLRDIDTDRAAGKRTLAVRLGRSGARALLVGSFALAFATPLVAVGAGLVHPPGLLPLLALPLAARPLRLSSQRAGPPLIAALKATGELELVYALLWALGMLLA